MSTTPTPNKAPTPVNPTPKARFMASGNAVSAHRELMQSDKLQQSIDFALLEYQRQLSEQKADFNVAAGSHFRMLGALEFISVLKTLAEGSYTPPRLVSPNLDHRV